MPRKTSKKSKPRAKRREPRQIIRPWYTAGDEPVYPAAYGVSSSIPLASRPEVPVSQKPWDHIFSVLSETDDIISQIRNAVERQIGNIDWGSPEVAGAKTEKLGSSLSVLTDRILDHRRLLKAIANTLESAG